MTQTMTGWMKAIVLALMGMAFLWLPACSGGPVATARQDTPAITREVQDYRLGPGDKLRITVFGEPNLSGEFQVDGAGFVSMPLIGEIEARGRTVREMQRATEQKLAQGYLREPRVSAEVLNFRPFYILGEVNKPGEYPFTEGLTVLNAIATANGFTYRANQKVVLIKGAKDNQERRIDLTPTTPVMPGDTIRVLERYF